MSRVACLFMIACAVASGCGPRIRTDYSELGLVDVYGKITLDGVPLSGAAVTFEATDGSYSFGKTDSSGKYRLMFNSEKRGVMPGPKTVRVTTTAALMDEESAAIVEEMPNSEEAVTTEERVPACYNTRSQLQVIVDDHSNRLDFDLKSDGSVRSNT